MNILLVIAQWELGGAQTLLIDLVIGLQKKGHRVVALTLYDKIGILPDIKRDLGVDVVDLKMRRITRQGLVHALWRMVCGGLNFFWIMKRGRFDVFHSLSPQTNIVGPWLALAAAIPIRLTSQQNLVSARSGVVRFLERWVTNSFLIQYSVAAGDVVRRGCIAENGFSARKVVTIPNSVRLGRFLLDQRPLDVARRRAELGIEGADFVLSVVARFYKQKGHPYLVTALEQVVRVAPQVRVLFIGDGPLKPEIEDLVTQRRMGGYIRFLGPRRDVPELLAISDVFVLPSLYEGLPIAVLEAMAAGLPVVATAVSGTNEAVIDRSTGLLVPPADPDALAAAILELIGNPDLRRSMGEAGRNRVAEQYSIERCVNSFNDLYLSVANSRRRIVAT